MSLYTFVLGYLIAASLYDVSKWVIQAIIFNILIKRQIVKALQVGQNVNSVPIEPLIKKPIIH